MKQKKKGNNKTVKYTVPNLEKLFTYRDLPHFIAFSEVGLKSGISKWEVEQKKTITEGN